MLFFLASLLAGGSLAAEEKAHAILKQHGIHGGLVVVLGLSDDMDLTAFRPNDRFVVQGLDTDPAKVAAAREAVRAKGLYGPVSASVWNGDKLPYVDNLVNVLVMSDTGYPIPDEEIERVLVPGGVSAIINQQSSVINAVVKPRPSGLDDWTHDLYDASGNAVAKDHKVGPPKHLQWTAPPLWQRSHGITPSVCAMVSANGRIFTIEDEAPISVNVPDQWVLKARDAFNGKALWKMPIPEWGTEAFMEKVVLQKGLFVPRGRGSLPLNAAKRLVAVGDKVYCTLGATAPVSVLDAGTGEIVDILENSAKTDRILIADGRLIAAVNPDPTVPNQSEQPTPAEGKRVRAFDLQSGKQLWEQGPFTAVRNHDCLDVHGSLEMVAGDGKALLLTGDHIIALDAASGEIIWTKERPALPENIDREGAFHGTHSYLLATLVYADGVVLLAQPEPTNARLWHTLPGHLYAFDTQTGDPLWKHPFGFYSHGNPVDVFVVKGRVFTHLHDPGKKGKKRKRPDHDTVNFRIQALDLKTGQTVKEIPVNSIFKTDHHNRCYRNRITEDYLFTSRRGLELIDVETGDGFQNPWTRSGCNLGEIPCNGMIYLTPHACACFNEIKLTGFNAMIHDRSPIGERLDPKSSKRLTKGPAYNPHPSSFIPHPSKDWPMFRADPRRSGAVEENLVPSGDIAWKVDIGGKPSAPVVADGKLYVADNRAGIVHALDATSGKKIWSFTAGGPVPSPPTVTRVEWRVASGEGQRAKGKEDADLRPLSSVLCIFGSSDGAVYCLNADDGKLVWRFDAAPGPETILAHERLESVWPVPGVLIFNDTCYFAAGRSSYLDGGIHFYALHPSTGDILAYQHIQTEIEANREHIDAKFNPGLLNDIPVTNGKDVFIRQKNMTAEQNPMEPRQFFNNTDPQLYSKVGFLDDSKFNRLYYYYGEILANPQLVLGKNKDAFGCEIFRFGKRDTTMAPGRACQLVHFASLKPGKRKIRLPNEIGFAPKKPKIEWQVPLPIVPDAMIRAGHTLIVAGVPDVEDQADPSAPFEGRLGGLLIAASATDGKELARINLPAPPAWHGLAVGGGKLYTTLEDGTVICIDGR